MGKKQFIAYEITVFLVGGFLSVAFIMGNDFSNIPPHMAILLGASMPMMTLTFMIGGFANRLKKE